jgi:hypothetical protein
MLGGIRKLLLLPVLFSDVACSYAFVHGPPREQLTSDARVVTHSAPDCTSSNAVPILDTVVGVPLVGAGLFLVVAGATTKDCSSSSNSCFLQGLPAAGIGIGAATALGALLLSSAATGYGRTADCRRAREVPFAGPTPAQRFLLDVPAIAQARAAGGS